MHAGFTRDKIRKELFLFLDNPNLAELQSYIKRGTILTSILEHSYAIQTWYISHHTMPCTSLNYATPSTEPATTLPRIHTH